MTKIAEKMMIPTVCMILFSSSCFLLTLCVTSSLAVDTIYYRYTNPKPANSTGDCYLALYITDKKVTGSMVDTRVKQGEKPWNTNITFNGTLTGKWEAGQWQGTGDQSNGRIVGTWTGRAPQKDKNMDRLPTDATNGSIEIFMGSRTNLRVLMGANVFEYNFRIEVGKGTVVASPKDPTPPPKPQGPISGGTLQLPPPATKAPKIDSRARFSNISGQVEVRSDDEPNGWKFAKVGMVLNVGDHIKTSEDSTCVIGFGDLSTFVMKPESEIVISAPVGKDSKVGLVIGNIWVNIKRMVKDGSMEVDLTDMTIGVKGTIFEAFHDRKTGIERVSVTEGKVEVRHKRTGKRVIVGAGQAARITSEGIFPEGAGTSSQVATPPQSSSGISPAPGSSGKGLEETLVNELGGNIKTNLVFYNGNNDGVINNGRGPTFALQQPSKIHFIMNYHHNGGKGAMPGTISFRDSNGKIYGPWRAGGAYGNRYWIVQPGITLPAGRYTIIDSDPATWSCNAGSGMYGHSLIKGTQQGYPVR